MRGMMRLLLIVGVLLCSMHLAEPASAHRAGDDNALHLVSDDGGTDRQDHAPDMTHSGHHHCPVAPDLRAANKERGKLAASDLLFSAPASRLTSHAPPPLLDPPTA